MKQLILFSFALFALLGCGGGSSSTSSAGSAPIITEKSRPLLVVRINYNDIAFTNSDPTTWAEKIFGNDEGELNHFYAQNSQNQFTFFPASESEGIINDGIVTVTLDKDHPDPKNNYTLLHSDFIAALSALDDSIDFAAFDDDGNSKISSKELLIVFIVAGAEGAYNMSISLPYVYAHQYYVSNAPTLDGVTLMSYSGDGNYAVFGERHCSSNSSCHDATIGIIAHELGHAAFDLPDLYDTTPSTEPDSAGIGYFGLMSAGMWGTKEAFEAMEGSSPSHFCAWSKIENGWVEPHVIQNSQSLHVDFHENSSEAYNVVKIPIDDSHYYLLENRHNSGYDRGLFTIDGVFKGGMALWKIDEKVLQNTWSLNMVNADENNKGVELIAANRGSLDLSAYERGHEKNLFYAENRDSFIDDLIRIEEISSRGEVMSATLSHSEVSE